jgi:hypothetical protein
VDADEARPEDRKIQAIDPPNGGFRVTVARNVGGDLREEIARPSEQASIG